MSAAGCRSHTTAGTAACRTQLNRSVAASAALDVGGVAITMIYVLITLAYLGFSGYLNDAVRDPSKDTGNPL